MTFDELTRDIIHPERAVLHPIETAETANRNITLHVKRCDLIHPEVNGNKWYKLKYNLRKSLETGHDTMLTFGGAFSNHIHATAEAGKLFGLRTIGIIRGEEPKDWSHTLLSARENGMQLVFIDRLSYAEKNTEDFKGWLHEQYGSFHLVPEGGSNFLGVNGCMEILSENEKNNYDFICCASGTGSTAAGLLLTAGNDQKVLSFPVFKNGGFIKEEIIKHLEYFLMDRVVAEEYNGSLEVITEYGFGGYAKWNDELIAFIQQMKKDHDLPLDQVYTGKLCFGILDLIKKNYFLNNSRILMIHSGGLQGLNPK